MTITSLLARRRAEPAPVLPGALDAAPPPCGPDPLVFGPQDTEPGQRDGWPRPEPRCGVHQVSWSGPGPCWLCATGVAPLILTAN